MSSLSRILNQLFVTARAIAPSAMNCNRNGGVLNEEQIQSLKDLIDRLPVEQLAKTLPDLSSWQKSYAKNGDQVTPCFSTELYEDLMMTLVIFNLRDEHCELPLHDHPGMHGFVRVLRGKVRVTSYSCVPSQMGKLEMPPSGFTKTVTRHSMPNIVPVIFNYQKIVSSTDGTCVLTPKDGNYHRIEAVDDGASFFDLLLPSYNPPTIDCHYYEPLEPSNPNELAKSPNGLRWLLKVKCPKIYWTDHWPYTGPVIAEEAVI